MLFWQQFEGIGRWVGANGHPHGWRPKRVSGGGVLLTPIFDKMKASGPSRSV